MTLERIKAIDGLRAIAVLGVLWAHVWMFFDNPQFIIFSIDASGIFSIFGTGVDLFFVISGFCMYLMYLSKDQIYSWFHYFGYLRKRWLRIAPAFYVAILVYGIDAVSYNIFSFDWLYALKQTLFARNLFSEITPYAPHFWSLGTEWHFYIVLPLVLVLIRKSTFLVGTSIVIVCCIIFRLFVWQTHVDPYSIINYSIPNRLIEFLMGVIAAKIVEEKREGWLVASFGGLIFAIVVTVCGRILMSANFHHRPDMLGLGARVFDLPLLALGYSLIIVNLLQRKSWLKGILEHPFLTRIGKVSYSMYLWHWIIAAAIVVVVKDVLHAYDFLAVNIVFVLAAVILYPVSLLSYWMFEQPYFKRRGRQKYDLQSASAE